jgi:putative peptidoglycan lipid II flippase
VAGGAQVGWSLWALRRHVRWTRAGAEARAPAARMLRRFLPALIGLGALQLNTLADTLIAMWPIWVGPTMFGRPAPLDDASEAILFYTQRLYQFPLGVFGIAVATVVFPALARQAADGPRFLDTLRRGMRLSLFIGLPASAGLMLVSGDLVAALYSGGSRGFSADGVARSASALVAYSAAVLAYSLNHTLNRAFYALGDARTPMRVAVAALLLALALDLILIWPLRETGLAWATAIGAMAQFVILAIVAGRAAHSAVLDRGSLIAAARIGGATAIMCAVVWLMGRALPAPEGWTGSGVRAAAQVGAGIAGFGAGAWLLRCPELRWLLSRRGDVAA